MFAKIGPGMKRMTRLPVPRSSSMTSVPTISDGIRSGVNCTRLNFSADRLGQRLDQQRLRQARHAAQQHVTAGEAGRQHLTHHLVLPDEYSSNLRLQARDQRRALVETRHRHVPVGGVMLRADQASMVVRRGQGIVVYHRAYRGYAASGGGALRAHLPAYQPHQMPRIAIVPGDGIGQDVTAEAVKVLRAVCATFGRALDLDTLPYGADHYLATGITIPPGGYQTLRDDYDAIFIGAVGDPRVPDQRHARDILLGIRFELDLYVNHRPDPPAR